MKKNKIDVPKKVAVEVASELPEMVVPLTDVEAVIFMQALETVDILRRESYCSHCGGKR